MTPEKILEMLACMATDEHLLKVRDTAVRNHVDNNMQDARQAWEDSIKFHAIKR